jgi:hypothetical protein
LIFVSMWRILKGVMTDDQFAKLERYLDERFDIIEQRMDFTERYMTERFNALEAKVDAKADRDQVDKLRNIVDGVVSRLDTIETELTVRHHQTDERLDRHEGWIKHLATQTQVRLESES